MRAFLFALLALVAAVSAGHLEQRSPFHAISSSLVARADVIDPSIIPTECKSDCEAAVKISNTCDSVTCLCTSQNALKLKTCIDCLVKVAGGSGSSTVSDETTMDAFASGCKAAGIDITTPSGGGSNSNPSPSSNPQNNNASGNGNISAALVLTANGGILAVALIGAVAYLF